MSTTPAFLRGTDTPTRMRVLGVLVALAAAVYGVVASAVVAARTDQLDEARAAAAQIERIETVRTAVVEADSLATAAYLAKGLESPQRRADYEDRLATASRELTAAAGAATGTDREALGTVSATLADAAGRVEQARANSRQGFPVGAAYQRSASALIRDTVLPRLDEVATSTRGRVVDAVEGGTTSTLVVGLGLALALAGVAVVSRWMLRRTNRVLNVGLVAGAALLVAAGGSALVSGIGATSSAVDAVEGPYAAATAFARARTAVFDAKSNESLTLIARGNGAGFEAQWQRLALVADAELERAVALSPAAGSEARSAFGGYRSAHAAVRATDDAGDNDSAVAAALALGVDDDLARFVDVSGTALTSSSAEAQTALGAAHDRVATDRWVLLVGGLAAAAAAFAGIARRVQEYR